MESAMSRRIHLDSLGGVAGDMFVAALVGGRPARGGAARGSTSGFAGPVGPDSGRDSGRCGSL